MSGALESLIRGRKRKRRECPDIQSCGWLKGKKVKLCGEFQLYTRESVAEKLKKEGARVFLNTPYNDYDAAVSGSVCNEPEFLCVKETELERGAEIWVRRFDVNKPWYELQCPSDVRNLTGHGREIAEVRVWLKRWEDKRGLPALFVYGPTGSGKKTLIKCVLGSFGFSVIDVCAIVDAFSKKLNVDPIGDVVYTFFQKTTSTFFVKEQEKAALLVFNANSLAQTDVECLKKFLLKRKAPVIFIDDAIDKKSGFWKTLGVRCNKLLFSPLSPREIASILYNVRDLLSEKEVSNSEISRLARQCGGDIIHALNVLEHVTRDRLHSIPTFEKKLLVKDADKVAYAITTPSHPASQLCRAAEAEYVLHTNTDKYVKGTGIERLQHLADICVALSDYDMMPFGSTDEEKLPISDSFIKKNAVMHMNSIKKPQRAPTNLKAVLKRKRAITRDVVENLVTKNCKSFYVLSRSSLSMELLAAYADACKNAESSTYWTVAPKSLDSFRMINK